jgi:leucyl/phenylalanyl-tRNA--protein transferase
MNPTIFFPDPNKAEDDGLIAVGGDLSPDFILSAYQQGIFPWFNEDDPILWWSPNPRLVLYPEDFKLSNSLKQVIRSHKFRISIDSNFPEVIKNCSKAPRPGQDGTWITRGMIDAYTKLHGLGYAHSFETYFNEELVGGLYGLSLGKVFYGESMFFKRTDASKFALYHLVEFCKNHKIEFIDAQQPTKHLKSIGAKEIERSEFLKNLQNALNYNTIMGKWSLSDKL